ncbi:protein canopy homolog 2-like [Mytilus californianus]|uniref:protein canopy homolog 2-like n=1 Tax=Mytilus californianus TaxID=6549 RepID=UPI0022476464|nr:protein canopy homolog 2-like [Mytilus californianus]XP_052100221.1 protein canopy homolog 2-like [Mytilus californianus]
MEVYYVVSVLIGFLFYLAEGKKDKELQCAVCRALVDEVNYGISLVDPKKTVQVGSFRVDGKGDQNTYKKPYARSEIHLTELFESICEKFNQYALTKNSKGGKSVVPTASRDGKGIALKDVTISSDATKQMKYSCETLVEEYEEDMIKVLGKPDTSLDIAEKQICRDISEMCTEEDLEVPMPANEASAYIQESDEADDDDDDDDKDDKDNEEQKGKEDEISNETKDSTMKEEL